MSPIIGYRFFSDQVPYLPLRYIQTRMLPDEARRSLAIPDYKIYDGVAPAPEEFLEGKTLTDSSEGCEIRITFEKVVITEQGPSSTTLKDKFFDVLSRRGRGYERATQTLHSYRVWIPRVLKPGNCKTTHERTSVVNFQMKDGHRI